MSSTTLDDEKLAENYLKLFELSKNKFLIGVFHQGITVYKQQIRALNIFHALVISGKIPLDNPNFTIGIVGGGIGGITFAAAAARINVNIRLFEKQSVFMHMQYGCDTRIVHPNIYDWPNKRYDFPYTEIPILNWRADTASNVAKQIMNSFQSIIKASNSQEIKALFDCEVTQIIDASDELRIRYTNVVKSESFNRPVNLVIFATGYGIEKGVDSPSRTPSYWRNDEFAQTILAPPKHYLLSGIGDGGLLDLFRLKILGFSINSFLNNLKKLTDYDKIIEKIKEIKEKSFTRTVEEKAKEKNWLHTQFETIDPDWYQSLSDEYFRKRIIFNCTIQLHGREDQFEYNLDLDRISILNCFIAFLISRLKDYFTYVSGELEPSVGNTYTLDKKQIDRIVILRQGTNKDEIIHGKLLSEQEIKKFRDLEKLQKEDTLYNSTDLLWPYSSLYSLLNSPSDKSFAFFTPESAIVCSNFVAILANGLRYHQTNVFPNCDFRICLHRIINTNKRTGYQQITPYLGNKKYGSEGVGRVHDLTRGIAGLSIVSGKPLRVLNANDSDYGDLLLELNLNDPYKPFGETALSIPILANVNDDNEATNIICFFEATDKNFFLNIDVIKLLVYTIQGFVNSINESIIEKQLLMSESDGALSLVDRNHTLWHLQDNACFSDLCDHLKPLMPATSPLRFTQFHSFDITYPETVDYLHTYYDTN